MSSPSPVDDESVDLICAACSREMTNEDALLKVVHATYRDDGRLAGATSCGQLIHRDCRDATIEDCPCGEDRGSITYWDLGEEFDTAGGTQDEGPEEDPLLEGISSTTQTYGDVGDDSIAYLPPALADRGGPAAPVADDPIGFYGAGEGNEDAVAYEDDVANEGSSSSEEDWNLYFGSEFEDDVCAECKDPISPYEQSMAVCHSWTEADGTWRSRNCGCRVHRAVLDNTALITECLHGPRDTVISYVDDGGGGPAQVDSPSSSEEDSSHSDSGSDLSGSDLYRDVCAECELPISRYELSLAVCHTWTELDGTPRSWSCGCRVHRPVLGSTALITECLCGPLDTVITYLDDGGFGPVQVGSARGQGAGPTGI